MVTTVVRLVAHETVRMFYQTLRANTRRVCGDRPVWRVLGMKNGGGGRDGLIAVGELVQLEGAGRGTSPIAANYRRHFVRDPSLLRELYDINDARCIKRIVKL